MPSPAPLPHRAPVLEALFGHLGFGAGDVTVWSTTEVAGQAYDPLLHARERKLVERASARRRGDFAAGRACAHAGLAALGVAHGGIGAEQRAPIWPDGVVGSITHTEGFAAAVVARDDGRLRPGIDAETTGRVDGGVARRIMSDAERARVADAADPDELATAVFGAKEAFYKAQWPLTRAWVGFLDVDVTPSDDRSVRLDRASDLGALDAVDWPVDARWHRMGPVVVVACVAARSRGADGH